MATDRGGDAARHIRTLFESGTLAGLSDAELLERFVSGSGEAAELAFMGLVQRHGPMVLRVCRRNLGDSHDAEDAFQATFLILVRKASSIRRRDSLASWLHGVALRAASALRASESTRKDHERRRAERDSEVLDHSPDEHPLDLGRVLHEELGRLPERYRAPLVLCDLEGRSGEDVARQLGWPIGTVKSRLARGRGRLRARLARRGLAPSVGLVGATLAAERAAASLPEALERSTARAASMLAAGRAAAGTVPASVVGLMEGVLRTMALRKLMGVGAALLALGLVATGAGVLARQEAEEAPTPPPRELAKILLPTYVVEPPDFLLVEVLEALPGRPISGQRLVRPDGSITLGFYGDVYVAGLTLPEIKGKIILQLGKFLEDEKLGLVVPEPDRPGQSRRVTPADSDRVYVDVASYNSKHYYVYGDVAAPGRYPITGNETVLDAISFAGGLLPTAAAAGLRLVRPPTPEGARERILEVDYTAIVHQGDPATNYRLMPGDRLIASHDPESEPIREAPESDAGPAGNQDLGRRLGDVEQKLDRVIELLEGLQTLQLAKPAGRPVPPPSRDH